MSIQRGTDRCSRHGTKQEKIGGGSEGKWCNKSLQSAETKSGQKEHLALHADIREPVVFCTRKKAALSACQGMAWIDLYRDSV